MADEDKAAGGSAGAHGQQEGKKDPGEHINIKVRDSNQNEVTFRIKKRTAFEKLMKAYCERQGVSQDSVRFNFDGERVKAADTPEGLGMEDDDTLEVFVMQTGGME